MKKKLIFKDVKIEKYDISKRDEKYFYKPVEKKNINRVIVYDIIDKDTDKIIKRCNSLNEAKRYCIKNDLNFGYL